MDDKTFSERHGFAPKPAEITVRRDAPHDLRGLVVDFAYGAGLGPHEVRAIACDVLMRRPDDSNWSPFPNVDWEVRQFLDACSWFEVYDIIEAIHASLKRQASAAFREPDAERADDSFARRVNAFFVKAGIGWQLIDGRIGVRGPEAFEAAVRPAADDLAAAGLNTAATEIHEALRDLARRPEPDVTGAMQHGMAAVECVAREACGDQRATLGEIIDRHPGLVPRPLDEGLKRLWGYASEMGRHLREGRPPSYEEAELAVITAAGVATYLEKKLRAAKGADV